MWYFSWILGTAFAVYFGIVNALSYEIKEGRCLQKCGGKKDVAH